MNSAGALRISNWISPPRACALARPPAAALGRGEKGANLFTQREGRGWGGSKRRLVITNAVIDFSNVEKTSQEELERIKAFSVPDLVSPYPWKRNQFADNAKSEAYRWLEEYIPLQNVYKSPEELRSFYQSDLAEWTVLTFVNCGEKELAWLAKLTLMTWIMDDDIDVSCSPEKAMSSFFLELIVMILWAFPDDERLYKNFVEFLDEGHVAHRTQTLNYVHSKLAEARLKPGTLYDTSSPEGHWICKAFGDLWAELFMTMPDNFLRRWALLWQTYLLENVREIMNRKHKTIPSVENYIEDRRHGSGFCINSKLLEFAEKIHVPDEVYDCPEMQRFLKAASDAISFDNDLWSFQREAMLGDVHNLVIVLSNAQDCSYEEAGLKTHQMMVDKLAEMEAAIVDLEKVRNRLPKNDAVEFQAYFKDFNHLFSLLSEDGRANNFFAVGVPEAAHRSIIHSRSAVPESYRQQAALDLKSFLEARAAELVSGELFFHCLGRPTSEPNEPTNFIMNKFQVDF